MPVDPDLARPLDLGPGIDAGQVLEAVPGIVVLIDAVGTVQWISEPMGELSGYRVEDLVGTNMLDHLDPRGSEEALASVGYALETPGRRLPTVLRFLRRDGGAMYVEASANNQLHNPAIGALVVHLQPCDERQLLDQVLEGFVAGEGLDRTIDRIHAVAGSDTLDAATALVMLQPEKDVIERVLGADSVVETLTASRAHDTPWQRAAREGGIVHVPTDALPDGSMRVTASAQGFRSCWCFPVSRAGTTCTDAVLVFWRRGAEPPEPNAEMLAAKLVKLCELILERAEHSRVLEHAASHDPLTGLANRSAFFDAVDRHLQNVDDRVGVLYLDLDSFKPINDRLGHGLGDRVLFEVARRLERAVRPTDTVARLGGDEFAVVCPSQSRDRLEGLAERLVGVISAPLDLDGTTITVGVSIGSALTVGDGCTGDRLVAEADASLLGVKAGAKGGWDVVTLSS